MDPENTRHDQPPDVPAPPTAVTPAPTRFDVWNVILALTAAILIALLLGSLWERHISSPVQLHPGEKPPILALTDAQRGTASLVPLPRDHVIWLVFFPEDLKTLPDVWPTKLRQSMTLLSRHPNFLGYWIGTDASTDTSTGELTTETAPPQRENTPDNPDDDPSASFRIPLRWIAKEGVQRRWGVTRANAPLHILIDHEGVIRAISSGTDQGILNRFREEAERLLKTLEPFPTPRFARVWDGHDNAKSTGRKDARNPRGLRSQRTRFCRNSPVIFHDAGEQTLHIRRRRSGTMTDPIAYPHDLKVRDACHERKSV